MIEFADVLSARKRIQQFIYNTPLEKSLFLSNMIRGEVFLKLECQQPVKAFKIRGAFNKLLKYYTECKDTKVVTVSSGNHGASVSYASGVLGLEGVEIYVPEITPKAKISKIKAHGAKLVIKGKNYDEAHVIAKQTLEDKDSIWIDSCSDEDVIAGQGTIGIEILEQLPYVDNVIVPIGGGGMITGIGLAIKTINPNINIIGVQTEACPAMKAALRDNKFYESYPSKTSICEALIGGVGEIPFKIGRNYIDEILLVKEESIKQAVKIMLEEDKVLSEPSGAVGAACLIDHQEKFDGKRSVVVVSGGNIDLEMLKELIK